jgi:hypothetical protein
MMAAVALIALALAVVVHTVRFQQDRIRAEQLRAEAAFKMAQADLASVVARAAARQRTAPAALKP